MEVPLLKLACQEGMVHGNCLAEKLDNLAQYGYEGIEFWGGGLKEKAAEIKQACESHSVKPSTICAGFRGSLVDSDKGERNKAVSDIKELLSVAADIGAVGLIAVPIFGGPKIPNLAPLYSPEQLETELLVELLIGIGEHAKSVGSTFLLEPLNRYETHFIKTLKQGVDICKKVGNPNVKIMADFFHMSIEEVNIPLSIEEAGSYIAHVHLADSTRLLPGYGHTDFKAGFAALKKIGYTGYMAMECGIPGDSAVELKKSADYLKGLM
jgi:sugar phosphate isomerase/epimerase